MTDTTQLRARIDELMAHEEVGEYVDYAKVDELRADLREIVDESAQAMADAMIDAFIEQIAPGLTCLEAEAVADLYLALGRTRDAAYVIDAHSYGDTEYGDSHQRTPDWVAAHPLPDIIAVLDASIAEAQR